MLKSNFNSTLMLISDVLLDNFTLCQNVTNTVFMTLIDTRELRAFHTESMILYMKQRTRGQKGEYRCSKRTKMKNRRSEMR